jgi:uncharacterized protein (TIGR02996 family)
MNRNAGFLEAVFETPDDDAQRLIYAVWLEGRGDPRGEFIHVQVDLEHLPQTTRDGIRSGNVSANSWTNTLGSGLNP